jgi:group I intron endonuclease
MILYIATNLVNGKRYVGMTAMTLPKRINAHRHAVKKGSNTILHNAIRKYGIESFTFEHVASSFDRESLQESERALIQQEGTLYPHGYNMTPGGDGRTGRMSAASVERMKVAQRRVRASETDEQKKARGAAISKAKKGKSQPWAREMGSKNRGVVRSEDFKRSVSEGMKRYIADLPANEMARRANIGAGVPKRPPPPRTEEQRRSYSDGSKKRYSDPEQRRLTAERTRLSWIKRRGD